MKGYTDDYIRERDEAGDEIRRRLERITGIDACTWCIYQDTPESDEYVLYLPEKGNWTLLTGIPEMVDMVKAYVALCTHAPVVHGRIDDYMILPDWWGSEESID